MTLSRYYSKTARCDGMGMPRVLLKEDSDWVKKCME